MTGKPQSNLQLEKLRKLQAPRKSTAHGRKPSDAAKTPPTQLQGTTAGVDQQTGPERLPHPPRVQSPDGRRRSANLRQPGEEPQKGSQLHDTQRKTADAPGKRKSSHTKRGSVRAYPTSSRRRGRRHSSGATERNVIFI